MCVCVCVYKWCLKVEIETPVDEVEYEIGDGKDDARNAVDAAHVLNLGQSDLRQSERDPRSVAVHRRRRSRRTPACG